MADGGGGVRFEPTPLSTIIIHTQMVLPFEVCQYKNLGVLFGVTL